MIKSELTDVVVEASRNNYTKGRNGHKVCKITPHHMAGVLTAEQCGRIFQNSARQASSNYGIGNDGKIACYVGEENRAWTSSSPSNDYRAITIEVSNSSTGGKWPISDKAWNSLVNLCVDICRRYNFRLVYDGTPNGSLTRHNMFANTNCPGEYLQSRFPELARVVNERLDGKPKPNKVNVWYRVRTQKDGWLPEVNNLNDYAGWNNSPITDVAIKVDKGTIEYQVHVKEQKDKDGKVIVQGKWLGKIRGYNINDIKNGYAGNGKPIDAIKIYYYTPSNIRPYKKAKYKVNNYGWQYDTETTNGQDGYAGVYGKYITKLQIEIV